MSLCPLSTSFALSRATSPTLSALTATGQSNSLARAEISSRFASVAAYRRGLFLPTSAQSGLESLDAIAH